MKTLIIFLFVMNAVHADEYLERSLQLMDQQRADRDAAEMQRYRESMSQPIAPVPVMPIERGSFYNSNRYGSTYYNLNNGVMCQSNQYGASCR